METEIINYFKGGYAWPDREIEAFSDQSERSILEEIWKHLPCQWPLSLCSWHWKYSESTIMSNPGESYEED